MTSLELKAINNAINELSGKTEFKKETDDLDKKIRDVIYYYSEDAYYICSGKDIEFIKGVLFTLNLHHIGALKSKPES